MYKKLWILVIVGLLGSPVWADSDFSTTRGDQDKVAKITSSLEGVTFKSRMDSPKKDIVFQKKSMKKRLKISSREVIGLLPPQPAPFPEEFEKYKHSSPPPGILVDTTVLQWDNDTVYSAWAFYYAGNGWGLRFVPPAYPAQVVGTWMYFWDTSWPSPGGNLVDVWVVDDDGENGSPGSILYQVTGVSIVRGTWNYIDLSAGSVSIPEGDFYIFYIQHDDYPNCPGLAVDNQGVNPSLQTIPPTGYFWSYVDGQYFLDDPVFYGGVFMIRSVVSYTPWSLDVGIHRLEGPVTGMVNSPLPIIVGAVNGSSSSTPLDFDANLEVIDLSTNTTVYTDVLGFSLGGGEWLDQVTSWTPSTGGMYLIRATTTLPGDEYPANDMKETTVRVLSNVIDFEADNGNFSSTGCWEWGIPTYGPGSAYSGVNVWATVLHNDSPNDANCQPVTPAFVVTGTNPQIGFAQWFDIEDGWDGGNVKISLDGGITWTLIEPVGGYPYPSIDALGGEPGFSGDYSFWHTTLFDLSGIVNPGDIVQFMFDFASDGSISYAGWYIDNFAYDGMELFVPSYDVSTDEALSPGTTEPPNATVTPMAQYTNNGNQAATFNAHLEITLGATSVYHEIVPVFLNPGESQIVTFPDWTTGPEGSTYTVHFWHDFALDTDPTNDDLMYDVVIQSCTTEDFEASDGGYTSWAGPSSWQWGAPTSGPGGAYSGVNVWGTNLAGDYSNSADWSLVTPTFSVTSPSPTLSYWHWYDIEGYWDGYNVKMSKDGGATWQIIDPTGGYPYSSVSSWNAGIPGEPAFSGSSSGWEQVTFDLTGLVSPGDQVMFRFHFGSDGSVTYPGVYVDDVTVCGMTLGVPGDVSVVSSSINPGDQIIGGSAISLSATVDHSPGGTQNATFRVFMKIFRDGMVIYQSFVDVYDLPPGEQQVVYFSPDWVPNEPGNYSLQVSIQIQNDPIPSNNILTVNFTVYMPTVMENLEYTMGTPTTYSLNAPYPNPSSHQQVRIPFQLPKVSPVRLGIYDATGRVVSILIDETLPPGYYTYIGPVASQLTGGVYFIQLETPSYRAVRKLLLMR